VADLQSFIQALYPERHPDEPQIMTPESAAARRTGRTQQEVDAAFPMAVRLMSAAQQHMVPPMGSASGPVAQGMRRFTPTPTRPRGQTIKDATTGYGVKEGDLLGPERLRMLAQHYEKHPDDWQALGGGGQGVVFRPPEHILDFLGLPPLTTKIMHDPKEARQEAAVLRALPNLQGQDLQKRYVGLVTRASRPIQGQGNRVDSANPNVQFAPNDLDQSYLFTREVPPSERLHSNSFITTQGLDWDRMKDIAAEATRRNVALGEDSFTGSNLWVNPQTGQPRLMDQGFGEVNPVDIPFRSDRLRDEARDVMLPRPIHSEAHYRPPQFTRSWEGLHPDNMRVLGLNPPYEGNIEQAGLRPRVPIPLPPYTPPENIDRDLLQ
jgi:hypothetical protein